jgi:hypothetical protein
VVGMTKSEQHLPFMGVIPVTTTVIGALIPAEGRDRCLG